MEILSLPGCCESAIAKPLKNSKNITAKSSGAFTVVLIYKLSFQNLSGSLHDKCTRYFNEKTNFDGLLKPDPLKRKKKYTPSLLLSLYQIERPLSRGFEKGIENWKLEI
jgi:hypothetical protein